jgi:hypothetical protein
MLQKGQLVINPKKPSWGVGRIVGVNGSKVTAIFEDAGSKVLDITLVALEVAASDAKAPIDFNAGMPKTLPDVDMGKVQSACQHFISVMENRRSNFDDAGVARSALREMEKRRKLSVATYRRLARWCHTEGSYQEGVNLAQAISRAIYGRVISSDEID